MRGQRYSRPDVDDAIKDKQPRFQLPDTKPLSFRQGLMVFGGITVVGLGIGAAIGTQIFFGAVALGGLVLLAESNPYVKYFIVKGNIWVDLGIFLASLYAMAALGVTVAGGLTIAGIGYTAVVAPMYRAKHKRNINR